MIISCTNNQLDDWEKTGYGYAVIVRFPKTEIEYIDATLFGGVKVERLDEVPIPAALMRMEQIRREFSKGHQGSRKRLVVITQEIADDDRSVLFLRGANASLWL